MNKNQLREIFVKRLEEADVASIETIVQIYDDVMKEARLVIWMEEKEKEKDKPAVEEEEEEYDSEYDDDDVEEDD